MVKTEEPFKVGVLFSRSGQTRLMENSMLKATLFSIEQVNLNGGINGRELVPIFYDPAGKLQNYSNLANKLLVDDKVKIIFGCYMSSSRKEVLKVVERHNCLLCYAAQYEGFEFSRNIIYCGAAPNQNSTFLGEFLLQNYGNRFYQVGSDYIFPRESNRIMGEIVKKNGGEVVKEKYLKLDAKKSDYDKIIKDIIKAEPQVIFCNFVGEAIRHFYEAYADAGLDPNQMPIASLTTSENDVKGLSKGISTGHLTAAPYFQTVESAANTSCLNDFIKAHGDNSRTDMCWEAAYFQVQIVANALRNTNSDYIETLRPAILNSEFEAPQGKVKIDLANSHTYLWPRIGKLNLHGLFDLLQESSTSVKPDPYLINYNPNAWGVKMQHTR